MRWRWQPGGTLFCDNDATQHRDVADFAVRRQTLRRATVNGDVPVAIEGSVSRTARRDKAPTLRDA